MKLENIQAQMRKGILEYCILAIISSEEIYASDIIGKLKDAKLLIVEGHACIRLLTRLEKRGVFSITTGKSPIKDPRESIIPSPAEGTAFLTELDKTWKVLSYSVKQLTSL